MSLALSRAVRAALQSNYEAEDADTLDSVAADILAAGASLAADGTVRYPEAALRIAPKLAPQRSAKGNSDEAKLERSEEITRRAAPLRKGTTDAREALKKIPPLPPNATDEQKCRRAAALTAAYESAGLGMESPDGD